MSIYLWGGVVKTVESTGDTGLKNRFLSKGENSSLKPIDTPNEICFFLNLIICSNLLYNLEILLMCKKVILNNKQGFISLNSDF